MIAPQQALAKLQRLVENDQDLLQQNMILHDGDHYQVFGRFTITVGENDCATVTYAQGDALIFSSARVALSWCIARKYQQSELAQTIQQLDLEQQRVRDNMEFSQELYRRFRDDGRRVTLRAKIDAQQGRLAAIRERLSKCVSRAKYCQIRGFNDEIARTRRPAPHRTTRSPDRKSRGTKR
jgi:hypothetical protein